MTGPAGSSMFSPLGGHANTVERVGIAVGALVGLSVASSTNSVGTPVGVRVGDSVVNSDICTSSISIFQLTLTW